MDPKLKETVDAVFADYGKAQPTPPVIYHYTSLQALIDIVQSGIIRLSNIQYSNDPAEVTYGHDLIREVLRDDFSDLAFGGVFKVISEIDYYAVAFSAAGDSLPQWRAYCSNGRGVALGFRSEVFRKHPALPFGRVEYEKSKQKDLVKKIINVYAPSVQSAKGDDNKLKPFVEELAKAFVSLAGILKDQAYATEQEYRAFFTQPRPPKYHTQKVKFRATSTAVVPFLEFSFAFQYVPQPIAEIVIGPCLDPALTLPSIEAFLEQTLQFPPIVKQSTVRMRP